MPSKSRHSACSDVFICTQEVTGSNPVGSTSRKPCKAGLPDARAELVARREGFAKRKLVTVAAGVGPGLFAADRHNRRGES
jgi:hypothetical protein